MMLWRWLQGAGANIGTMIDLLIEVSKLLDATYGVRDQPGVAYVLYWRSSPGTCDTV